MWANSSMSGHASLTTSTDISLQHIGNYIEDYIDLVENVPNDVARLVSQFHETNGNYQSLLKDAEDALALILSPRDTSVSGQNAVETNGQQSTAPASIEPKKEPTEASKVAVVPPRPPSDTKRRKAVVAFKRALVAIQQCADDKLEISQRIFDTFDYKARQLDSDFRTINAATGGIPMPSSRHGSASGAAYGSQHMSLNQNQNQNNTEGMSNAAIRRHSVLNLNGASALAAATLASMNGAGHNRNGAGGQLIGESSSSDGNERDTGTPLNSASAAHKSSLHDHGSPSNGRHESGAKDGNGGNKRQSSRRITGSPRASAAARRADTSAANISSTQLEDDNGSHQAVVPQPGTSASSRRSGAGGKRGSTAGAKGARGGSEAKKAKSGNNSSASGQQLQSAAAYSPVNYYEDSIDPDEPTYCLCKQISFGEMICCDNDACPTEWFHFQCVNLAHKPKGKWYCPNCRGDRANVQKK